LHYLIVTHLSETAHGNDREEHTKEDSFHKFILYFIFPYATKKVELIDLSAVLLTYLPRYFADDYPITASTSENEKTQLTPINMVQIYKKQRLETNDLPLKCKLILRHIDCDLCLVTSINNCRDTEHQHRKRLHIQAVPPRNNVFQNCNQCKNHS